MVKGRQENTKWSGTWMACQVEYISINFRRVPFSRRRSWPCFDSIEWPEDRTRRHPELPSRRAGHKDVDVSHHPMKFWWNRLYSGICIDHHEPILSPDRFHLCSILTKAWRRHFGVFRTKRKKSLMWLTPVAFSFYPTLKPPIHAFTVVCTWRIPLKTKPFEAPFSLFTFWQ